MTKRLSSVKDAAFVVAVHEAIEAAAISGLCRDGQIEIGVQEARKTRPDLCDEDLLALVMDVRDGDRL